MDDGPADLARRSYVDWLEGAWSRSETAVLHISTKRRVGGLRFLALRIGGPLITIRYRGLGAVVIWLAWGRRSEYPSTLTANLGLWLFWLFEFKWIRPRLNVVARTHQPVRSHKLGGPKPRVRRRRRIWDG